MGVIETKEHRTTIDNIDYIIIHDEQYITVRKYNKKAKMWIEFIYDKSKSYDGDSALIDILTKEYIQQQKKSS